MKLVLIPGGEFLMGSPGLEPGRGDNEGPQHEVEISRPFYMGVHEVTVGQYRQFTRATNHRTEAEASGLGSHRLFPEGQWRYDPPTIWQSPGFVQTDTHPVVCVNWNDAMAFCEWLTQKEQRKYRLPTEAEWEYCCRGGTKTRYCCGDDEGRLKEVANVADQSKRAVFPFAFWACPWNDGHPCTAPVGKFKPNAFGLFDLHGNVHEWCEDWYEAGYFLNSPKRDPAGPAFGNERVLRGGAWTDGMNTTRSAWRNGNPPHHRGQSIGFRVLLSDER